MDDGTMASTDEAMALIRAADADPRGTVLMLLRVLGSGLATATRERDEARAETADLRAAVDTMQVQLDAHREWLATAQATGDEARAEVERLRRELAEARGDFAQMREDRDAYRGALDRAIELRIGDRAEARLDEREACAAIATPYAARWPCAGDIVAKIRARGAGGGV